MINLPTKLPSSHTLEITVAAAAVAAVAAALAAVATATATPPSASLPTPAWAANSLHPALPGLLPLPGDARPGSRSSSVKRAMHHVKGSAGPGVKLLPPPAAPRQTHSFAMSSLWALEVTEFPCQKQTKENTHKNPTQTVLWSPVIF